MTLVAAADVASYRAAPAGHYLAGPSGLVFCARPDLWGFAVWGRPTPAEVRATANLLALELRPPARRHASLVDARGLEAVDPEAFAVIEAYVTANFAALGRAVERLAIVRPPGFTGATVAGFFAVQDAPYPVKVLGELRRAVTWVGGDATLAAALDAAVAAARGQPPLLAALRRWLEAHLGDAALPAAARALGHAPRSLQRHLRDAGTAFQRELDQARVRVAQRRLETTRASLTEIALDVGCASPQHFSALFRRVAGEPPSAWRARHAAAVRSSTVARDGTKK
ncbi:MAG: helix-turn-helix transcriptional regulator [Kofleriaceae bacterium]|nr:helix-turn-helix transcriptional regulator [Kofleriaceae bacterium]MCL4224264.1 AraC family transcriptional regulator [Myxococcales bacterium]